MAAARRGGKRVGYIRVSSVGQNEARQLDGLQLDKVFTDKASGKDTARPKLQAALEFLREGDLLVVHSMDRLARDMRDLQNIVKDLTGRDVAVEFVSERLVFRGDDDKYSTLLLHILGGVAQFERALIRERQAEGIAKAKAAGVYKGRKPSLTKAQAELIWEKVSMGVPKAKLAREFGVSRETLYSHLRAGAKTGVKRT
jgi:DNA invertase Pin-like site-specific DNA recombinase